jgi:hypothetical protein
MSALQVKSGTGTNCRGPYRCFRFAARDGSGSGFCVSQPVNISPLPAAVVPTFAASTGGKIHSEAVKIEFAAEGNVAKAALALSHHSIKAARYTTKYLIGRLLGAYLGKLISIPTTSNASARTIAPRAPGLKLRDTSIVACLVAVGALYQTGRKPMPLRL